MKVTFYLFCVGAFVILEVFAFMNVGGKRPSFSKLWFVPAIVGSLLMFGGLFVIPPIEPHWLLVTGFLSGLILSVTAVSQLDTNFSAGTKTPERLQTSGLYRYLENPDYIGLLIMLFFLGCMYWGCWILLIFYVRVESASVADERKDSIRSTNVHKIDSSFWTFLARVFGDST